MEHRWSQRLSLSIGVLLYQNGIPVARCRTRNVGAEGMFVDCGSAICAKNAVIDVEFEAPAGNGENKRYSLPAMVMHVCEDGMGLIFLEIGSEAFHALRRMVRNVGPQPSDDTPAADTASRHTGRSATGAVYH